MKSNLKKKRKKKKSRMAVNSTATKKEYKQSSNIITKVIITIVILVIATVLIFVSGTFNISEILVENNNIVSSEQIISFSGLEKGVNIFSISKKEIINKIKENPYVNNVEIKRILPNKIKLIVDERKVEYALPLANSNTEPTVPTIIGFITDLSNIKTNDKLVDEDLKKINMVDKIMNMASNHNLKELITKMDVSDINDYTLYLDPENKTVYLGDGTDLNTRFLYIKKLLELYKETPGEIIVNGDLNKEYVYFRKSIEG